MNYCELINAYLWLGWRPNIMINDLFSKNQNHEIVIQVVSFQGWNSSNIPLLMTDLCYFPIGGSTPGLTICAQRRMTIWLFVQGEHRTIHTVLWKNVKNRLQYPLDRARSVFYSSIYVPHRSKYWACPHHIVDAQHIFAEWMENSGSH